jgi:hypothetical protein
MLDTIGTVLLLGLTAATSDAPARFEGAVRAGVSTPIGEAVPGGKLGDLFSFSVPVRLELGARLSPTTFVGAFGEYGFGILPGGCGDCSGRVLMFGVEGLFHLVPNRGLDPWLELGGGFEVSHRSTTPTAPGSDTYLEELWGPVLEVQAGLDIALGKGVAVGPWIGLDFGLYLWRTSGVVDQDVSTHGIDGPTVHAWFTGGVRLAVTF